MIGALAPQARLVGALALAAVIVATPLRAWPVFVLVGALIVVALVRLRTPARWLAGRLGVVAPFVAVAAVLPFVALGERVPWGLLTVSRTGAAASALLVARCLGALGVALVLARTTPLPDLVDALAGLRLPAPLVLVVSLMLRYLGVVVGDVQRMGVARASRGDGRGTLGRWGAAAAGVGRLFVRSYERGERVHLAMVARGYDGTAPAASAPRTPVWHWLAGLAPALALGALAWGLA